MLEVIFNIGIYVLIWLLIYSFYLNPTYYILKYNVFIPEKKA